MCADGAPPQPALVEHGAMDGLQGMEHLPSFSVVDIIALIVLLLGAIQGFRRGLSGQLARLISVVVALVLGLCFYAPFGAWCAEHTRLTEEPARVLAFVATVLAAIVVMIVLRLVLGTIMKVVIEKKAEKIGGCSAGLITAGISVFIVFVMMNMLPEDYYLKRKFGEESVLGTIVVRSLPMFKDAVERSKPTVEEMKSKVEDLKSTFEDEQD
jgi:membrane protein required for colicin V production